MSREEYESSPPEHPTAPPLTGVAPGLLTSSFIDGGILADALLTTWSDVRTAARWLGIEKLAGSPLMPSVLRFWLLRMIGIRLEWPVFGLCSCIFESRHCRIGRGTFINRALWVQGKASVDIGRDCLLGPAVMIVTADHKRDPTGRVSRWSSPRPVRIGDRCWLGARVTVLPGVTIGDDVVIAAGAVVSEDCPAGGVYGGIPARRLR